MMRLRLTVSVVKPDRAELVNQLVPEQRGHDNLRNWWSPDFDTPAGLPLKVWVHFGGDFGQIQLLTAATQLFRADGIYAPFISWVLLPTDEELEVQVRTE